MKLEKFRNDLSTVKSYVLNGKKQYKEHENLGTFNLRQIKVKILL